MGDGKSSRSGGEEEKKAVTIGRNKRNNSKIELVDFKGMPQRVKKIKQRKSGVCKKRKRR